MVESQKSRSRGVFCVADSVWQVVRRLMRFAIPTLLVALFAVGCVHLRPVTTDQSAMSIKYCPKCGAELFFAIPGVTTKEQIRSFAIHSKLPDKEEIARDGWIHPGAYCSNGCYEVLLTFEER